MFTIPKWLAQMLGSIILAAIAGFLYAKTRERFMALWMVGWGLALIAGSPVESVEKPTALVVLYETARVVGASFILRGNSEFLGRKVPAASPTLGCSPSSTIWGKGTQFDPGLVDVFVRGMGQQDDAAQTPC